MLYLQDKIDDILLGIKSTALKFGDETKFYLTGFGISMISNLLISGFNAGQTLPYYAAVGLVGSHLFYQVKIFNLFFILILDENTLINNEKIAPICFSFIHWILIIQQIVLKSLFPTTELE